MPQTTNDMAQEIVRMVQERFNTVDPKEGSYHMLPEAMWLAMQSLCGPMVAAQVIRACSTTESP
jgi:hypothetical protein